MFNQGVGLNQECIPSKESGFNLAINEVNGRLDLLTGRLESLYHRIEPFMSQTKPTNGLAKQPSQPKPQAILRIDSISDRILDLIGAVEECISRLEI